VKSVRLLIALGLILTIALSGTREPHEPDQFNMYLAATVPYFGVVRFVCTDADHDGQPELYLNSDWDSTYAVEHVGGFRFEATYLGFGVYAWDIGDADRDGLADLVGQDADWLQVHESPDSFSFPHDTVRVDSMLRFGTYATLCDLDGDSMPEIVCNEMHYQSISIYECVADDSFELKAKARVLPGIASEPRQIAATFDVDRDGRQELMTAHEDWVAFFEAVQNDSFVCVAACSLLEYGYVSALAGAEDVDRDGRPEAFAYGADYFDVGRLVMIESPADDSFEIVWDCQLDGSYGAECCMSVGDIDGDSVPELAFTDGSHARVFQCAGSDSFVQVWQVETYHQPVRLYDIDGDGHCELIIGIPWATAIYAYGDSVGIVHSGVRAIRQICVSPSVTRGTPVRVAGIADGAEVGILDATGRVVAEPKDGVWNPRGVSPGAYFVRVRAGNQAVVQKVLVLR
jgi:hypothetical protein